MQIVREYSDAPSSSLAAYLYLLREMKPMIVYSLELRHLIAEQGLLRLFFILMRCCNRSEPSNILLSELLQFLELFTVRHDLTMKLIEKQEQIKDFNMLLLKYYQNNGWELFEQICALLQSIVNDQEARKILRTNRIFTEAVEYVYKRLFNKALIDEERSRQQVRSTPKHPIALAKRRVTLLNRSSMQHITPQMRRRSAMVPHENVFTKNLLSIEKFMKVFYHNWILVHLLYKTTPSSSSSLCLYLNKKIRYTLTFDVDESFLIVVRKSVHEGWTGVNHIEQYFRQWKAVSTTISSSLTRHEF